MAPLWIPCEASLHRAANPDRDPLGPRCLRRARCGLTTTKGQPKGFRQGVLIAGHIRLRPVFELGGRVGRRGQGDAAAPVLGIERPSVQPAKAECHHLGTTMVVDPHLTGREISMDETRGMTRREPLGGVDHHLDHSSRFGTAFDPVVERGRGYRIGGHEQVPVNDAHVAYPSHVRVIDPHHALCLAAGARLARRHHEVFLASGSNQIKVHRLAQIAVFSLERDGVCFIVECAHQPIPSIGHAWTDGVGNLGDHASQGRQQPTTASARGRMHADGAVARIRRARVHELDELAVLGAIHGP